MDIKSTNLENAFLVHVHLKKDDFFTSEYSLKELDSLVTTLGIEVLDQTIQSLHIPDRRTYIGIGKLQEIKEKIKNKQETVVILNHDLTGNQSKNLEKILGCMVWDRTQVILEIFSAHARTWEAKAQVELARLYYMLPRLTGMWSHLDREKGGAGVSRGMGEKQINVDRTLVRKRIGHLQKKLKKISQSQKVQRQSRNECFQIGIVGYTNAGKSTLLNLLTRANVLSEDMLFATLTSTTKILTGITKPDILISDTVGFIQNLPHSLVASFRSTLEVLKDSDLLLQVLDASSPLIQKHIETTQTVLKEIEADHIPRLLVLNKIDKVKNKMDQLFLKNTFPDAIQISAHSESSILILKNKIKTFFESVLIQKKIVLPYEKSNYLSKFYEMSQIENIDYKEDGIHLKYSTTKTNQEKIKFIVQNISHSP